MSSLVVGHDAPHELIKHRNGEGGVPVPGTPNHAFADQFAARGGQGLHLTVQLLGDFPGTVGPGTKLGHGTQISFFGWSQPVKPDEKEACVKGSRSLLACRDYIRWRNGGCFRDVPYVLAPLLQEVRVALGLGNNLIKRVGIYQYSFAEGGLCDGGPGIIPGERPNLREVKQALGIRLCVWDLYT